MVLFHLSLLYFRTSNPVRPPPSPRSFPFSCDKTTNLTFSGYDQEEVVSLFPDPISTDFINEIR